MSAALTLAGREHAGKLLPLVAAFHAEEGIALTDAAREQAVLPLLDGIPHGSAYLIGPPRAPIGYVIVTFGWSVEFGGLDGFIDELYVRPGVRGRGIATEVLLSLPRALADAGLRALHLEVRTNNPSAQGIYAKAGFRLRDGYHLMTRSF